MRLVGKEDGDGWMRKKMMARVAEKEGMVEGEANEDKVQMRF